MKQIYLIALVLSLAACSEKKEEKKEQPQSKEKTTSKVDIPKKEPVVDHSKDTLEMTVTEIAKLEKKDIRTRKNNYIIVTGKGIGVYGSSMTAEGKYLQRSVSVKDPNNDTSGTISFEGKLLEQLDQNRTLKVGGKLSLYPIMRDNVVNIDTVFSRIKN